MDENELKQMIADILKQQADGIGLIVAALARQMDANRLAEDLRLITSAAQASGTMSSVALLLTTAARAAADAESALRKRDNH